MNVHELIDLLYEQPGNLEVVVYSELDGAGCYVTPQGVDRKMIRLRQRGANIDATETPRWRVILVT